MFAQEAPTVLDGALQPWCVKSHMGDTKALGVTLTPFKVVHDRPGEVGGHVDTLSDCTAHVVDVTPTKTAAEVKDCQQQEQPQ